MRTAALAAALVIACGGGDGAPDATAPPDDAPVDAPPFALTVTVSRGAGGGMAVTTNLPARVAACRALAVTDPPCADRDGDGLVDAWEDLILDRLRPMVRFDEDESLIGDRSARLVELARVAPVTGADLEVVVFIALAYSIDYGSCGGFTGHNGDSERVALHLAAPVGGGPGDVAVVAAYTTGHEGTANDQSRIWRGAGLAELVTVPDPSSGAPRWVVFPSADKHATYGTLAQCEAVSVVPCFDEDCGPDGVADPAGYQQLPAIHNVGEPGRRLIDDLTAVGFPGDTAWGARDFCGGRGGTSCSAPLRDKLIVDPFGVL